VEEKIPNFDFLGTRRSFPIVSTSFSCALRTLGASEREEFEPFAIAAASHESPNTCAKKAVLVLVVELPPSGEEITVEEGLAEITQKEGMGLFHRRGEGDGGAGLRSLGFGSG